MKNLYFVLLSICFSANSIYAQPDSWYSSKSAGGSLDDVAWGMASTYNYNERYVTGSFKSPTIVFGSFTLTNSGVGTSDIFLVKYTNNIVTWAKSYGTVNDDEGRAIAYDYVGDFVYFAGYFNTSTISIGTFTLANNGADENFIAKVSAGGTVLWANSTGGSGTDRPRAMCVEPSGAINVVGDFASTFTTAVNTLTNAGNFDIYWMRYAPTGTILTATAYGSTDRDDANSIAAYNGFYYIGGATKSPTLAFGSNTITNANAGTYDGFILEVNSSFVESWVGSFGAAGDEQTNSVAYNGTLHVTGTFNSSVITVGNFTLNNSSPGTNDILVVQINTGHNAAWAQSFGGNDNDAAYSVLQYQYNVIYVAGSFNSTSITVGTHSLNNIAAGKSDVFIAAFDETGAGLLAKSAGGNLDDVCFSASMGLAMIELAGWYSSPTATFGLNPVLTNAGAGTNDVFSATLIDAAMGLKEVNGNKRISLYPNPTNGILRIVGLTGQNSLVEIHNALGQKVFTSNTDDQNNQIDISDQTRGIYFVNIKTDNGSYSGKILVE